jgi:hypothetical protein
MRSFLKRHESNVSGVLHCFDRLILRGHLPMAGLGYFSTWLYSKKISLNVERLCAQGWQPFKTVAPAFAEQIKQHAKDAAERAGRPYQHLSASQPMEQQARLMAERDGITGGLVCVYSVNETCRTFRVRYGDGKPRVGVDLRVCSVLYYFLMDRDYGLMHVKIQTWFPFTVQVYVNGHEWLARQLTRAGIEFRQVDNAFTWLADAAAAQRIADRFAGGDWPGRLDRLAAQVNPLLGGLLAGQSYYWVIDQCEYSTDVLFSHRAALEGLRPRLYEHATLCFSAPTLMTFLGRRYRETFAGAIHTKWHRREAGAAVKHWIKRNALKMYDKDGTVLRIETVIHDPREFYVRRQRHRQDGTAEWGWFPMNKGVLNLRHYARVSRAANTRYLEALAVVEDLGVGRNELERRLAPVTCRGRRRRGLQPLGSADQALFTAVLRGEYAVRGFRNGELAAELYGPPVDDPGERRRRCGRVSRRIALLRAHGLLAKIPRARRYRVTPRGQRFMSTALQLRARFFPEELSRAA